MRKSEPNNKCRGTFRCVLSIEPSCIGRAGVCHVKGASLCDGLRPQRTLKAYRMSSAEDVIDRVGCRKDVHAKRPLFLRYVVLCMGTGNASDFPIIKSPAPRPGPGPTINQIPRMHRLENGYVLYSYAFLCLEVSGCILYSSAFLKIPFLSFGKKDIYRNQ